MRMRKKRHGAERIALCADFIVHEASEMPPFPCELEIGCGKGAFICECAKRHPSVDFVAMEKIPDVLLLAAEKVKGMQIPNVRFIVGDAKNLRDYFPEKSVNRIYLNFSDPWPKSGHYKRRLTYRGFLEIYREILTDGGEIVFKTDNRGLFDFSLGEFSASGFELRDMTYDLHNSPFCADNIETEYEKIFSEKGFSINRVVAKLKNGAE